MTERHDELVAAVLDDIASSASYEARHIKRARASAEDMEARRAALLEIVAAMRPMTVRQAFYQASVRGLVDKSESGYSKVQRTLVDLRRSGRMPFSWIADNTRWMRKPDTFRNPREALRQTAEFYRKALWADAREYVECWIEKDALASVIYPVTQKFDVPLMVSRGYASISFLHEAASDIQALGKPAHIYHLGDAANKVEASLREFAPDAEIYFERLAVLPSQIDKWNLPSRPTKATDSRARGFSSISVELDAIDPHALRGLVHDAIERHLPADQYRVLLEAESSEREFIERWADLSEARP